MEDIQQNDFKKYVISISRIQATFVSILTFILRIWEIKKCNPLLFKSN